ncbi:MARVEL domain-containing protein 3 isoform X2 [Boleophthalmus pectinirostris]|uniref:MARVEL domain-containing protein 3 isoform X2 n=1 Tax=Boleophthalmus pectinirostris TaxID=150288 RepID=UPI000A1C7485|nr:MARVEL domain-containing protein 3 isoform X2 [Boleophthalmus pectinirostris]XP_020793799.1 MARVEL domain-containing protein 3 isoform X2 [Boleophthalmus pectinirostris]
MSSQPRSNRGHRDRNGDGRYYRDHENRRSSPDRSSSQPPYYPREDSRSSKNGRDVPRVEHRESDSKCTHMCSRRGIVLICAVLTNALVLICVVAAHMVTSGMSAAAGMGGFNINSNFNLQGTELQKVRDLDMQYSQMRAPTIYGGISFSLTFGVISLLFVVSGNKPPHLMSRKLLVGALIFQAVGAVLYIVAVGLYLHFIIRVNSTDVCQQRKIIYSRNGYTWMNCDVSGADAAVALFGLITAILYIAGTVLTFKTIRAVNYYLQERKRRHADRNEARSQPHSAPLRAATSSV